MNQFCQVAVNFPHKNSVLTYSYDQKKRLLDEGEIINVDLGNRKELGCVIKVGDLAPELSFNLEKIKEVHYDEPTCLRLTQEQLSLFKWMAEYYHYPLGRLIFDSMPRLMKRPRPMVLERAQGTSPIPSLNSEQKKAYQTIERKLDNGFGQWLLHGVTGSGKSIVYLSLIEKVLGMGKSVLYLVPEINLTPQFLNFFSNHLAPGIPIYAYHSELTDSDRFGLWSLLLKDSSPKIIVGVRSSVFLPIGALGLIVVDEEHDASLKQEGRCPYHARDVAIKLASMLNIPIVLGSATPSLETYYNFSRKNHGEFYCTLKNRANHAQLPEIILEDLKSEKKDKLYPLTSNCIEEIRAAFSRGEQALVFINRLGFANYLQCSSCGHQFVCRNCSSSLRYFKARNYLSCSYCDYTQEVPVSCPECQCLSILQLGYGTEKVAGVLQSFFYDKKIARFDRDEIKNFEQLKNTLEAFHNGSIDLLVGTQMLSKGHNFEKVNLVIVLGVDSLLNFSDFRSSEKAYQLISQVAGRSGRFGKKAKVIIPTLCQDNPVFKHIQLGHFSDFFNEELLFRNELSTPPYSRLALLEFTDKNLTMLKQNVEFFAQILRRLQEQSFSQVSIMGPRPSLIEKKVNKYSWLILLKSKDINQLHNLINTLEDLSLQRKVPKFKVDIDPQNLL